MPGYRHSVPLALATALLGMAFGCGTSPAVPQVDTSKRGYGPTQFRDDAKTNSATPTDFPKSFIDANGNPVDLTTYRGRKVVLVVLRGVPRDEGGAFCPSCLAQAGSLMANREAFESRKVEVLVLFPGPADRVGEFVQTARRRVPGEPKLSFQLLLDQQCEKCEQLGIRDNLAKPATYVLDTYGRVTFAYVGETSTDRPSVNSILAQLDVAE